MSASSCTTTSPGSSSSSSAAARRDASNAAAAATAAGLVLPAPPLPPRAPTAMVRGANGNLVRTREWHQIKCFHQYLMIRPHQGEWKALHQTRDQWVAEMRHYSPGMRQERALELFHEHFERVGPSASNGAGLWRMRFNRRSANPLEWISVDFFSKGRALDPAFLRFLMGKTWRMKPAPFRAAVPMAEFVRDRTEEEDRQAKDTFLLAHRFLYDCCAHGLVLCPPFTEAERALLDEWAGRGLVAPAAAGQGKEEEEGGGRKLAREALDLLTYDHPLLPLVLRSLEAQQGEKAREHYRKIIKKEAGSRTCFFRLYSDARFLTVFGPLEPALAALIAAAPVGPPAENGANGSHHRGNGSSSSSNNKRPMSGSSGGKLGGGGSKKTAKKTSSSSSTKRVKKEEGDAAYASGRAVFSSSFYQQHLRQRRAAALRPSWRKRDDDAFYYGTSSASSSSASSYGDNEEEEMEMEIGAGIGTTMGGGEKGNVGGTNQQQQEMAHGAGVGGDDDAWRWTPAEPLLAMRGARSAAASLGSSSDTLDDDVDDDDGHATTALTLCSSSSSSLHAELDATLARWFPHGHEGDHTTLYAGGPLTADDDFERWCRENFAPSPKGQMAGSGSTEKEKDKEVGAKRGQEQQQEEAEVFAAAGLGVVDGDVPGLGGVPGVFEF